MKVRFGIFLCCALWAVSLHGGEQRSNVVENPHFDPSKCSVCHESMEGNVSRLCLSCHDGEKASREIHPVGIEPSSEIASRIPEEIPLRGGELSCLSCHDILMQCKPTPQSVYLNRDFLRGDSRLTEFCAQCHLEEDAQPFNAHDQLDENGEPKEDVCLWCHVEVPEVTPAMKDSKDFGLRRESHVICRNCHPIPGEHPVGGSHILATPSPTTIRRMAEYVGISIGDYLDYQVFPLDEKGRITCFSCHNPHQKGLFPDSNPRALGAEPVQAVNKRLRRRHPEEPECQVCHIY